MSDYQRLARRYFWVTWVGIFLNMLFVLPLVLAPDWILKTLNLYLEPTLWARISGMLLFIISVFYIPAALHLERYRANAWIAIFPSRVFGSTFFFLAVFVFGFPLGYLPIAFVDLTIYFLQLLILLSIRRVERGRAPIGKPLNALAISALLAFMVGTYGWYNLFREVPQKLANDSTEEFFKYGSIGGEQQNGLPYWIWLVLPQMFPEYLPGPGGYASLGLAWEQGREMPVGFTRKTIGFDRVAFNCAFCHAAKVRTSADDTQPRVYPAGPSHTFNAWGYQRFLLDCASDERFTTKNVLNAIESLANISILDKILYRVLIPLTKKQLLEQKEQFAWVYQNPEWGPGRIDPFNPVKIAVLRDVDPTVGVHGTIGNSDMVPIWNLRRREGMALHWDGLNTDITEVVRSSAIGDGATPKSIPLEDLQRLQDWLMDLAPPPYPFLDTLDADLAKRGAQLFGETCAICHAFGGERAGQVIPASQVGTDPHRVEMWTPEAAAAYNEYASQYPWGFRHFRSTEGYAAPPLDAVWIRAPYLHNGSVPSLTDMLTPPSQRPKTFYRGSDIYDPVKVGFLSNGPEAERGGFLYDTSLPGNSNQGHPFGTVLPDEDKRALIEYLKTL